MLRPSKQLLVCLIGADGSGKTTLGNRLVDELAGEAACVWLGAESILMRPVRAILQMLLRPGGGGRRQHTSSAEEASRKQSMARRFRWLRLPYTGLVLFDYWLQYRLKRARFRRAQILVLDRYLFDVGVNLAITLDWSEDDLIAFLQRHFHRFSLPRVCCLLRVTPELSIRRKNDIPDAKYVEMRVKLYERIARDFGFHVLEASRSVDDNLRQLMEIVEARRRSTHVHYVHSNNRDVGGADFCLARVAKEVRKQELTVTVSLRIRTEVFEQYAGAGIPVMRYPFCRPQLSRGTRGVALLLLTGPWTILYFLRLFRSLRPDIVHVNDLYDFLPALAARMAGIPVVYHIRMIRERALERRMFRRLLFASAVASVSVSQAVRRAYFPEPLSAGHHADVIYDWPDDRSIAADGGPCPDAYINHAVRVVMVGRIDPWKGQHVFVEAVKQLRGRGSSDGVGFFLAGGMVLGEEKRRFWKEIVSSAEGAGIVYLGHRQDVCDLLKWADVSVHASTAADPFPGVVLESLLAETATIASAAGGVLEMIESGTNGILVTPNDPAALADAIECLLGDPELRARLSANGRKNILKRFEKTAILQQLLALYSKVQIPTDRTSH